MGVTIIAILQLLAALAQLALGALQIMGGLAIPIFGMILVAIGAVILIMGIIGLILFWGLWTLKGWAWWLTFIINLISIILGAYNFWSSGLMDYFSLVYIILPLIIVIYLFFVRSAFK